MARSTAAADEVIVGLQRPHGHADGRTAFARRSRETRTRSPDTRKGESMAGESM